MEMKKVATIKQEPFVYDGIVTSDNWIRSEQVDNIENFVDSCDLYKKSEVKIENNKEGYDPIKTSISTMEKVRDSEEKVDYETASYKKEFICL